jgi:septum site-determining protein MinD
MGRVYAVASAKGGVGKTTTTANLGAALAATDASVAVVDADLGMPNLGGAFGVAAESTVHDALAGDADASAAVREGVGDVAVLAGSDDIEDFRSADPAGLCGVVSDLAAEYDYVVLDGGAGLNHDSLVPISVADEVVLVTGTGRDAHGDTAKTRTVADRLGTPVAGVVVGRVAADASPDLTGVDGLEDLPVLGVVPESPAVAEGTEAGEPVVLSAPEDPAAGAYRRIAWELTGEPSLAPDGDAGDGEAGDGDEDASGDDEAGDGDEDASGDEADDDAEAATERDDGVDDDGGNDAAAPSDDRDGDASGRAVDDLVEEAEATDGDAAGDEATDDVAVDDEADAGVRETALFSSGGDVVDDAENGRVEDSADGDGAPEKKGFLSRLFGLD